MKDLGSCDLYPQSLQHTPMAALSPCVGRGVYHLHCARMAQQSFGTALEFVWGEDSNIVCHQVCSTAPSQTS